jgi:hypothetical protein
MSVSDWVYGGLTLAIAGYLVSWLHLPIPWNLVRLMRRRAKPEERGRATEAVRLVDAAASEGRTADIEPSKASMVDIDSFDGDFD